MIHVRTQWRFTIRYTGGPAGGAQHNKTAISSGYTIWFSLINAGDSIEYELLAIVAGQSLPDGRRSAIKQSPICSPLRKKLRGITHIITLWKLSWPPSQNAWKLTMTRVISGRKVAVAWGQLPSRVPEAKWPAVSPPNGRRSIKISSWWGSCRTLCLPVASRSY